MTMPDLVDAAWLDAHLDESDLVVVDASIGGFRGQPRGIPGARRFDIDGELSRHDTTGVHDMVAPAAFERLLRELGIRAGDRVVAYDAKGIFSSARAWWMLEAAGIDAAVLDGGLPAWESAGMPLAPIDEGPFEQGDVTVRWRDGAFVDADTVADAIEHGTAVVLDARSGERFTAEVPDPRPGLRPGHIPGSASLPYASLEDDGHLLPVERLAEQLDGVAQDAPVIATCGSGVTACIIALAATLAGRDDVRVYDGSWADWARPDSGRDVATGA